MKLIIHRLFECLCLTLLLCITANAQDLTFNLAQQSDATPLVFDAGSQPETTPLAFDLAATPSDSELTFDLAYVLETDAPTSACECGCNKPGCTCSVIAKGSCRKPFVRMNSASWCSLCRSAKEDVAKASDCPFELQVVENDNTTEPSLPVFTWEAGGKWWSPIEPGYRGLPDLIAHWRSTQPAAAPRTFSQENITGRVQQIAHSVLRPMPALGKPGDSKKKSIEPSATGNVTNGVASAKK